MKTFGFDVVTWAFGDLKISSGFEDGTRNHLTIVTWSDGTTTTVREEAINGRPAALTFSKAFCYRYFGSPDRFRNNVLDNLKHYDDVLVYEWKGVYTGIGKDLKTCDIYDFAALAITSALYGSTYQVDEILEKYMDISYDMRKETTSATAMGEMALELIEQLDDRPCEACKYYRSDGTCARDECGFDKFSSQKEDLYDE